MVIAKNVIVKLLEQNAGYPDVSLLANDIKIIVNGVSASASSTGGSAIIFAAMPPIGPPKAVPRVGATVPTIFLSIFFILNQH